MKLSAYFSLEELTFSETAARLGIQNQPSDAVVENLKRLAFTMDEVRVLLARPVHINSGYRSPALEHVIVGKGFDIWCAKQGLSAFDADSWVKYLLTKAHPDGRAADFVCREYGDPLEVCRAISSSGIAFDQLIYEHTWVHLAIPREGEEPRLQALTLMPDNAYAVGLIENSVA